MVIAAHPHTGLQTATWLFEGRFEHRDSIGTVQYIEPGQLNLMTAGRGIAHSELAMSDSRMLHSVQLWIALPDSARKMAPEFEHQGDLPKLQIDGISATIFAGELEGYASARAATKIFSPMVGAELRLAPGAAGKLALSEAFEHGFLVVQGSISIDGLEVKTTTMDYREPGSTSAEFVNTGAEDAIVIMLGGKPFDEPIVMWWNFIERSHEEIVEARDKWNSQDVGIPAFEDQIGGRTPAPDLPNVTLRARL